MQPNDEERLAGLARDWIVRLASGHIAADELRQLKSWLAEEPAHQRAFERERTLWQQLASLERAMERSLAEDEHRRSSAARVARKRSRRMMLVGGCAAACLALIVLYQDLRILLLADHRTSIGRQQIVALPDGGSAHLNTDTAIAVSYTADERRIELLRGEALFDVVPDRQKPFRVLAQGGITQAVGTAFAVHAQEHHTRVVVTKGTVAVSTAMDGSEPGSTVTVQKNQQTAYRQGASPSPVETVESDALVAWARGNIVIEREPFARAMAELNRYRSGRIVVLADASRTKPVSGRFTIAGLDEAIVALAATQHLRVLRITDYLLVIL